MELASERSDSMRWRVFGARPIQESRWVRLTLVDVEPPDGRRFEQHVVSLNQVAPAVMRRQGNRGGDQRHEPVPAPVRGRQPHRAPAGMGARPRLAAGSCIFSYDRTVRVGFKVDAGVVPDPWLLVEAFDAELDDLLRLARAG
jgi:hypothetical protein